MSVLAEWLRISLSFVKGKLKEKLHKIFGTRDAHRHSGMPDTTVCPTQCTQPSSGM